MDHYRAISTKSFPAMCNLQTDSKAEPSVAELVQQAPSKAIVVKSQDKIDDEVDGLRTMCM